MLKLRSREKSRFSTFFRNGVNSVVHKIWESYPTIEKALHDVKRLMKKSVKVPMVEVNNKILEYIDAPGKYLRSGLTIMVADSLGLTIDHSIISAAAGLELLHLSTLIHDDVIDKADTRRGVKVIQKDFSNKIAIYAGDYLLSVSGRLMDESNLKINRNSIDNKIIEHILIGELRQLMNQNREDMTINDYLRQIKGKTATLFGLAVMIAGFKAELPRRDLKRLYYAGQMIGMAFQLNDDLIDYHQTSEVSGKPRLQDVQNGIYTAPYLMLKEQLVDLDKLEIEALPGLMKEYQIFEAVETIIASYLDKSWHYFELVNINSNEIKSLLKNIDY